MKPVPPSVEMTPERHRVLKSAIRLELITLAFLASVVILMYLVMGSSQAMKTAWVEDLLSVIPPLVFLGSAYLRGREPCERFPYGFHRISSIAFLTASLALLVMGGYLLVDSLIRLVRREHPSVGAVELFGTTVWLGWLMLPVLLWSVVPAVLLGRAKVEPARRLHDKTLYADAMMNKADWMTGVAAMLGVLGIAVGWWWADALAAMVISLDIFRDGVRHVWAGITDLMDRAPRTVDDEATDPFAARLVTEWKRLPWVEDASVRLREHGHVFFGEAFIRPVDRRHLLSRTREALEVAYRLDWRLQDLVLQMVSEDVDPTRAGSTEENDRKDESG